MGVLIGIVFCILAVVLGLVAAFLVLPLRLELLLTREDALRFSAAVRPFGHFGPRIPLSGGSKTPEAKKKPRSKTAGTPSRRKSRPMRIAQAGLHLCVEVLKCIRLNSMVLDLKLGLGDPAETGQLYGHMTPLICCASDCSPVSINIEPVFDRATLTGRAEIDLSLLPIRLIAPVSRFGWAAFGPVR